MTKEKRTDFVKATRAPDPDVLRRLVLLLAALGLVGCVRHAPNSNSFPSTYRSYLDLCPGWRLRIVTPLLKSGKFVPEFRSSENASNAVELSSSDDLIGYETSDYLVVSAEGKGVRLIFVSAENSIDGRVFPRPRPQADLLKFPPEAKFIRIVFLTRVSSSDHNQAILAATNLASLDALTEQVEAGPPENCRSNGESNCIWVPLGIAVRAEKRDPTHHKGWIPAM
jgi:hypothetical protein